MAGPVPPPLNFKDNSIAEQGGCCTTYDAEQVRFSRSKRRYEVYNTQVSCCIFGMRNQEAVQERHRNRTNQKLDLSLQHYYQVSLEQAAKALDINLDEPLTWSDCQRIQVWAEAQKVSASSNSYFQDADETMSGLQMRLESGELQPLQLNYIIERMRQDQEEKRKLEEKSKSEEKLRSRLSDDEAQKVALAVVDLLVQKFAMPNRGEGIVTPRNVQEAIQEVKGSARGALQQEAMMTDQSE